MRPFSTLGWFMLETVGAVHIDETTNPIMQAWMVDAIEPIEGRRSNGMTVGVDWGRAGGKSARLRQMAKITSEGKIVLHAQPSAEEYAAQSLKRDAELIPCPLCNKPTPKSEIDGAYPYECCEQCYWELPG